MKIEGKMEKITHKTNKEGKVVIEATGELFSFEAVLAPKIENGRTCIPKSSINTYGIDNSQLLKDKILDSIQKNKGVNGESPVIVENI